MNKGVEILLARMDSHPQEFERSLDSNIRGRWAWILDPLSDRVLHGRYEGDSIVPFSFLTAEEAEALVGKFLHIQHGFFTKAIMKELFDDSSPR